MGLLDIFKVTENKKLKANYEALEQQYLDLKETLTPELNDVVYLKNYTKTLEEQKKQLTTEVEQLLIDVNAKKKELIVVDEESLMQSFGLYTPVFNFTSSEKYKEKIQDIRAEEKVLIKADNAILGRTD